MYFFSFFVFVFGNKSSKLNSFESAYQVALNVQMATLFSTFPGSMYVYGISRFTFLALISSLSTWRSAWKFFMNLQGMSSVKCSSGYWPRETWRDECWGFFCQWGEEVALVELKWSSMDLQSRRTACLAATWWPFPGLSCWRQERFSASWPRSSSLWWWAGDIAERWECWASSLHSRTAIKR